MQLKKAIVACCDATTRHKFTQPLDHLLAVATEPALATGAHMLGHRCGVHKREGLAVRAACLCLYTMHCTALM
jgi:hypothetical protein